MHLFVAFWCLVVVAVADPIEDASISFWPQPPQSQQRYAPRINEGLDASQNQAPFICSLRWTFFPLLFPPDHVCGASLLSMKWALTAAHCKTEMPDLLRLGRFELQCGVTHRTNDIGHEQRSALIPPAKIITHEQWIGGGAGPNDIAVIDVPTAFTLNDYVKPIRLRINEPIPSNYARLFGWGYTDNSNSLASHLQTIETVILTNPECRDRLEQIQTGFGNDLNETNICTANGKTAACGGDSGGPLVYIVTGDFVQIGIVSWGISPCGYTDGVPSVFTRVSAFIGWIASKTGLPVANFTVDV